MFRVEDRVGASRKGTLVSRKCKEFASGWFAYCHVLTLFYAFPDQQPLAHSWHVIQSMDVEVILEQLITCDLWDLR